MANGSLTSRSAGEDGIREGVVRDDLVDCVVALPGQLFFTTPIPVCLLFLDRDKTSDGERARSGEMLFIDARSLGSKISRTQIELTERDLVRMTTTYHAWRGQPDSGEYADQPGFCRSATMQDVEARLFSLAPSRYVGNESEEEEGDAVYAARIEGLTNQLRSQFEAGSRLQQEILSVLDEGRNVLKIGSGATPRGGARVYQSTGTALIRSQNITNEGCRWEGLAHIGDEHATSLSNVEVEGGDVLLNITGDSVARVCRAPAAALPARVNQHVAIIRPDADLLDRAYLH